jgi:rod shape-determining protein MreD
MRQVIIILVLLVAIALPSALAAVWLPLASADLVLIVVVYFALQREPLNALLIGAIAGVATDALSRGLLGAGGFSKVLTAYAVYFVASRVMLDTTLLRIPVLAAAALIDNLVYFAMNRLLGQSLSMPFAQALSYRLIATTVVGTILLYIHDTYFSEKARHRRQFSVRRRVARGGSGMFGRKRRKSTSRQW